ncbi:MAG: VCBS repeat-containing protein [Planctomycetaceae bacterium]|nr:VCBS repeat-containing protein [Planctomycetaceae bacterium]
MKLCLCTCLFWFGLFSLSLAEEQPENLNPKWSGAGEYRILFSVPADENLGDRAFDERVVSAPVDFAAWLQSQNLQGAIDLSTLQLHRFDPQTGEPLGGIPFDDALSLFDTPCRFEEEDLSGDYPSRVGRPSETDDGRPRLFNRPRKARLFNREMSAGKGKLIWAHAEKPGQPGFYALYFNLKTEGDTRSVSPAPWTGDADLLRRKQGEPLGGFSHFTATLGDLNGDGLEDLIAGTEKGDLFWFPNRGNREKPVYTGCQILRDEEGPIDCGWYAAPFVYDWNNDGLLDLLVGSSGNILLWWKNTGAKTKHEFQFQGFVQSEGDRLRVPEGPVSEDSANIFKRDYYNQPWIGDLNGDSLPELVTGGYTTGRIFKYESVGRNSDGTPQLTYGGELKTPDGPIDTVWAAAPWMWDANADGLLDMLTGTWYWSGIEDPPEDGMDDYLRYYQQQADGKFIRSSFPMTGHFPRGVIARPSLFYVDNDETPDMLISDNAGEVYFVRNIGEPGKPLWEMPGERLTIPWGFDTDWDATRFAGSQSNEVLIGTYLWKREGAARSPRKKLIGPPQVNGEPISHPGPGYGDAYHFTHLYDWNNDGHQDILWGTQQGNIYIHLHTGGDDPMAYEPGQLVQLTNGEPLKVGPPVVASAEEATDFTILQGSRIVFTLADFDQDGIDDLLVGETFAQLWFYQGQSLGPDRKFAPGQLLATLKTRPNQIVCTSWNDDEYPDLLLGGTATEPVIVYDNKTQPGKPALGEAEPITGLPYFFWGPRVAATDWNQDGDVDLMIQSEFFSFWVERSFLDHGYYPANALFVNGKYLERRPNP